MKQLNQWCGLALGSLVLAACAQRDAVVKEPPVVASADAVEGAGQAPQANNYTQVPSVDVLGGGIEVLGLQGAAERVALSVIEVAGQPFSKALRAETKEQSQNLWDVQLLATNKLEVKSGDVLLASFWFRTESVRVESGEAETEVNFELNERPFEKSLTHTVRAGAEWKQMHLPFVAKRDFKAGEARLSFRLGYSPQTVQIAELELRNFEHRLALADLPRTKATYPGMEPDAPWRAQADERIDRLRKADLTVRVLGQDGRPVAGADVSATLTRHAFNFGTATPAEYLLSDDRKQYNELFYQNFNMATLENDLKWEAIEDWPGFSLERGVRALDSLREAGLRTRCHVLVWPSWRETPQKLQQLKDDKPALRKAIADHIRQMVTTLKGRCDHWDVVNEPFTNHDVLDTLGYEVMADWFRLARSLDPKPKLYINDFAILSGGGGTTPHRDHYEKMIQLLADNKTPFDGIGMQGHFGSSLTGADDLMAVVDRYAKFNKEIAVTELDVVIDDEELAGRYVRDFYTVLFSHPAVSTLVMWGFWDTNHWKKNAVMYRDDFSLKPGGQAYQDLVLGKWRTDEKGATDAQGVYTTRGFKGSYDIVVKAGGRTQTVKGVLADGGARIDVKI